MIFFESEICADFAESASREWLETNGIGGYVSSTISGANTRRYHGLLTAATKPPLGRLVLLSKFEETLTVNGKSFRLSANQYPENVFPEGYKYLKNFRLDPFPIWTFEVEGTEIEKSVFMIHGENSTVIRYRIVERQGEEENLESGINEDQRPNAEDQIKLELKPLLAFRDYHHLRHEEADFNSNFETSENLVSIQPYAEMPRLFFSQNSAEIEKTGYWYQNFVYQIERERSFDFTEDLFQPFSLKFDLSETAVVVASTAGQDFSKAAKFEKAEINRRKELIKTAGAEDDFVKQLVLAADQFIVGRGEGKTVIAGYHWFSDWGRDTMIALPGLTLATNRAEIARQILLEFSNYIFQGILPNRFPDAGETPEYNTADATLWYFEAIRAFVEKTEDYEFVRENLYEKLVEIIYWHLKGTRYNIHVDTDGLLCAGETGTHLTWMDAKSGETVFTPRVGKPVEIQALWYNALCVMTDFAGRFGDKDGKNQYLQMAQIAKQSFNRSFWNEAEECLFDVVENGNRDAAVRPNQIFAVSLKNSMLDRVRARKVVEKVEVELLTPYGLRSLSPKNENYRPSYEGGPFERDSAYHQGTVWGWLIGGFIDAYRRVFPEKEERIGEMLKSFEQHLREAGIGQISEIFDAEAPHAPRGCIAQAWSVAEVLRVIKSD